MRLEVFRKRVAVHEAITGYDAASRAVSQDVEQSCLASAGLAHERRELPGRYITGDVLQKLSSLVLSDRNDVVEVVERERFVDLRRRLLHHLDVEALLAVVCGSGR